MSVHEEQSIEERKHNYPNYARIAHVTRGVVHLAVSTDGSCTTTMILMMVMMMTAVMLLSTVTATMAEGAAWTMMRLANAMHTNCTGDSYSHKGM